MKNIILNKTVLNLGIFFFFVFFHNIYSQDLEPRILSPIPIGGNFIVVGYGFSTGNILVDQSLPIEDLNSDLNTILVAYASSFKMFKKLAKFDVSMPYTFAKFDGVYLNADSVATRNGLGDPLLRLSINLVGTKPLRPEEFIKQPREKFNLGISFRLRVPLGQYDETKFLNLGANRWGFKFGLAGSYRVKKFIFEGHIDNWIFTKNNSFYDGNKLYQQPILSSQVHVAYIINQNMWLAGSFGKAWFGDTVLNDVKQERPLDNSRYGLAYALRLGKKHSIKLAYTSGLSVRYGTDFSTYILGYQYIWFNNKK